MRLKLTWLVALALAVLTAGCSSAGVGEPAQAVQEQIQEPALVGPPAQTLEGEFNERDVAAARAAFDAARAVWDAEAPADYRLQIGPETVGFTSVDVEGGIVVSEETDAAVSDWTYPRSIEQLFDEVDAIITVFEANPDLVPDPDECGQHFRVRFDVDVGYPVRYDQLGPCDDGVGIIVLVTPS